MVEWYFYFPCTGAFILLIFQSLIARNQQALTHVHCACHKKIFLRYIETNKQTKKKQPKFVPSLSLLLLSNRPPLYFTTHPRSMGLSCYFWSASKQATKMGQSDISSPHYSKWDVEYLFFRVHRQLYTEVGKWKAVIKQGWHKVVSMHTHVPMCGIWW